MSARPDELEDVLLTNELVPTVPNKSAEQLRLRTASEPQSCCGFAGPDVILAIMYLLICIICLAIVLVPPEAPLPKTFATGDVVSAGLVRDAMAVPPSAFDPCDEPYAQVCTHFAGKGLLRRRQERLLDVLGAELKRAGGVPEQLQRACEAASETPELWDTTAFDEWAQGKQAGGIQLEVGEQPWFSGKPGRHLFVGTGHARRGPNALGPFNTVNFDRCPAARTVLDAFAEQEPLIKPFLERDVYTNDAVEACRKFEALNLTRREPRVVSPMSEHACAHLIGSLVPNHVAPVFNRDTRDWKLLTGIFKTVRGRLIDLFKSNPRASEKLAAIRLKKWPSTYPATAVQTRPAFVDGNWTHWRRAHEQLVWRAELDPNAAEPEPIMMPWEVNAFYSPDHNMVYIPPGLLSIFAGGSRAFQSASVTFIVAHELSHSIDPSSIHYDLSGQYVPIANNSYPPGYFDVFDCLVRNAKRRGVPPIQTLGESFADALGWHMLSHDRQGASHLLQALGFMTNAVAAETLFARVWCTAPLNLKGAYLNYSLEHDEHPPANFRVDNTLAANNKHCPQHENALESCMALWAEN